MGIRHSTLSGENRENEGICLTRIEAGGACPAGGGVVSNTRAGLLDRYVRQRVACTERKSPQAPGSVLWCCWNYDGRHLWEDQRSRRCSQSIYVRTNFRPPAYI